MRSRILALALAAIATTGTAAIAGPTGGDNSPPKKDRCDGRAFTTAQFEKFSFRVWRLDRWGRKGGDPKDATIRRMRLMRRCAAGPRHRVKMKRRWRKEKSRYFDHRSHCRSGPKIEGKVSFYSGGMTGDGIHNASEPGIAIRGTATYGEMYRVHVEGSGTALLMHFDYGPATWTGRAIDITYAGAAEIGSFETDDWGEAKMIPGDCL